MKIRAFIAIAWCLMGLFPAMAAAQNGGSNGSDASTVLFRVGNEPVTLDEFEYVYRKNNPKQKDDYSREALEEYLELYINFKLKVKEARNLRIDTLPGVRSELDRYRRQLVKSYFDKAVTDGMAEAAYDRMMVEVDANHIMVEVQPTASPEDTAKAWARIQSIRERLLKGADFAELAKDESDDPSASENGGNIGFLPGLYVPDQSFEDALFETPRGRISNVVRTRFGYHVVKPGARRDNRGKVQVAHILLKVESGSDKAVYEEARQKAQALRDSLEAGADWETLVTRYSGDKSTVRRGGMLEPFGSNQMVDAFEEASFALQEEGEVSNPVRTQYGYHLIKLIDKQPIGGFDDTKADIMRRLQRAGRYQDARERFVKQAQRQYGFEENDSVYLRFRAAVDSGLLINTWRARRLADREAALFRLGNTAFTSGQFADHVESGQRAYRERDIDGKLRRLYDQFVEESTIEYALGRRDEAFRRLLQEYRDGILLFELTEDKVWQEAMRDSVGLVAFHAEHADDYRWEERVEATTFTISDAKTAKKARKMASKGASPEEIRAKYNKEGEETVQTETSLYLPGQNADVDAAGKVEGAMTANSDTEAGQVVFVRIDRLVPATNKTLDEAKGYVISDYQEYLEKEWVKELRAKYPVKVNESVFEGLVR
jgi:peptidyl-prolyl cis-trans isomerase SurA